jgi:hypothetical protein
MKHAVANTATETAHAMQLSENVIYLMGTSFVIGSLFTILILLLLDFMRRDKVGNA